MELLHQFHHLKSMLCTVVENAQSVAHNLPDHNHNAEEAKWVFTRVRILQFSKVFFFYHLVVQSRRKHLVLVICLLKIVCVSLH